MVGGTVAAAGADITVTFLFFAFESPGAETGRTVAVFVAGATNGELCLAGSGLYQFAPAAAAFTIPLAHAVVVHQPVAAAATEKSAGATGTVTILVTGLATSQFRFAVATVASVRWTVGVAGAFSSFASLETERSLSCANT